MCLACGTCARRAFLPSIPPIWHVPLKGWYSPVIVLSNVVFPTPFGPRMHSISPSGKEKLMFSNVGLRPLGDASN